MARLSRPGILVEYDSANTEMHALAERRLAGEAEDTLILLEHPPVFTAGRRWQPDHIVWTEERIAAAGFEVETYMNCRALAAGLRIVEVPSVEAERIHGVSNLRTFRDGFRVLITIFREWRTHRDGWVVASAAEGVEDAPLRAGVAEPASS